MLPLRICKVCEAQGLSVEKSYIQTGSRLTHMNSTPLHPHITTKEWRHDGSVKGKYLRRPSWEEWHRLKPIKPEELPSANSSILKGIIQGERLFAPHEFSNEEELEKLVIQHYRQVLGEGALYLPIRKLIGSTMPRVTDGLLLDLNDPKNPSFWIVEVELSKHDLESHIQTQMLGFHRALKKPDTKRTLLKVVWVHHSDDVNWVKDYLVRASELEGSSPHEFLDNLLHEKNCGLLIFIDNVTDELREIMDSLSETRPVKLVEFKTFKKDSEYVHLFTRTDVEEES